jgi:hypothetical protein
LIATSSVTLDVWLDQGPDALTAVPDFTITHSYNVAESVAVASQTKLIINRMARKAVYRVRTNVTTLTGSVTAGTWRSAPRLISVAFQASTGWVHNLKLNISSEQLTNTKTAEDFAYQRQSVGGATPVRVDEKAAYNFARQLLRLKGGECKATFVNGDSFNAYLEDLRFKAVKPQVPGGVGQPDRPGQRWEGHLDVVLREDV